ncbi:MAG: hypothetical protein WCA78_14420 [Rhizomicrobium sp.]
MTKLTFYEQVGIVIPGALFLAALIVVIPKLQAYIALSSIGLGEFGIFLLVAYGIGEAIAAIGNVVETIWWKPWGGMPSNWVTKPDAELLNSAQVASLTSRINSDFGISVQSVTGLSAKEWRPIFGQIYRAAIGIRAERIDTFNSNYGLNRGLASAFIALLVIVLIVDWTNWKLAVAVAVAATIYLYRMHRFGVHFAKEVFFVFLNGPKK